MSRILRIPRNGGRSLPMPRAQRQAITPTRIVLHGQVVQPSPTEREAL
ncbi:MAG: hypothetical protein ACRDRJ_20270 [Streptosporangiaceae bacterium]